MRKALVILVALMLVAPAMAQTTYSNPVVVTLDIPSYSSVEWQDLTITYADGDYWCMDAIEGYEYSTGADPAGKTSGADPWAGDPGSPPTYPASAPYWESGDQADIYVASNDGLTLQVQPTGDLTSGSHSLESYFTAAAAWCETTGFIANGTTYAGGWTPPPWNYGQYLANDTGSDFGLMNPPGTYNVYPTQKAFAMAGSPTYTLAMTQTVRGTFTFHGRVVRNGIMDPAGTYTADLDVTITGP